MLEEAGAAFVVHDHVDNPSPAVVTADFAYVRFHGTEGVYYGSYGDSLLEEWSETFAGWFEEEGVDEIYAYFNNDIGGTAPSDARRLLRVSEPPRGNGE